MASLNNMDLPSPLELILDTEFDTIIQDFAAKALIPGVSILIHRHENAQRASETTFKAYGVAYDEEPVTENIRFPICSMTKHIIALALLRLLDSRGWDHDTLVREVLPEFRLSNEPDGAIITFAHILSHTTGIDTYNAGWTEIEATGVSFFNYLAELPTVAQPGLRWSYANTMYDVCVTAIEKISGEDVETYLKSIFFEPLGMAATSYRGEGGKDASNGHINSRVYQKDGNFENKVTSLPFGAGYGLQWGSSNIAWKGSAKLVSCTRDMAKWVAYLPTDPFHQTIIKPRIHAPIRPTDSILDQNEQYGLGLFIGQFRGVHYYQHLAEIAGFCGLLTYLPKHGISIVSLSNSSEAQELDSLIAALIMSGLVGQETDSIVDSLTLEREQRQESALYNVSAVEGLPPCPDTELNGAYIGLGIGRIVFTPESNVQTRPRCDTTVWLCWQHGDIKPIIAYVGDGKYSGCLEYRQWSRESEQEEPVRYTRPFSLEKREDGTLWASELFAGSPFMLRPE